MKLILTSDGLSSQPIIDKFADLFRAGFKKAAIVVTADPEYREKDWYAVKTKEVLDSIGFTSEFFDIEFSSPKQLHDYDIVYFIGGNPFYLLKQIRETHTDIVFKELVSKGKVISGASAGSIVMGTTIGLIYELDPDMNKSTELTDFTGVGLTKINMCPHYSRFINHYDNLEERICKVEHECNISIVRLDDGQAIIVNDDLSSTI